MALSLGALNALVNLCIWGVHAILARISECVYATLSEREVARRGCTSATDISEISPSTWLLHRRRTGVPSCWVLTLLLLLTLLLPLELLVESGISTRKSCTPRTERNATGVCAAKYEGHSHHSVAAAAVLTQNFKWVDETWDVVVEGMSKSPKATEVHRGAVGNHRRIVASQCKVSITRCKGNLCGTLDVEREGGAFDTIVKNASIATSYGYRLGDVTYDKAISLAFLFWESNTSKVHSHLNRERISILGVETLLRPRQLETVLKNAKKPISETKPWTLHIDQLYARRYSISCLSDGISSSDIVRAVSLYRTAQMEQPGVRRTDVKGSIENVTALSASDVIKAVYALKAADWSPDCMGDVDVYSECGSFAPHFIAPFFTLAGALAMVCVLIVAFMRGAHERVPVDARSWREKAVAMAHGQQTGVERENIASRRELEATYDPRVFATAMRGMKLMVHRSYREDGGPNFAADGVA